MKKGDLVKFRTSADENTPGFTERRSIGILLEDVMYVGKSWANVLFADSESPVRVFRTDIELA